MNYVHRDGPVALRIPSTSGLPDGCSLSTAANGVLVLTCNANPTNATRNARRRDGQFPTIRAQCERAPIPVSFSVQSALEQLCGELAAKQASLRPRRRRFR
ncbi:MAG: hypothetical protein ACLR8Y_15875 [Alistipes indistinctus]